MAVYDDGALYFIFAIQHPLEYTAEQPAQRAFLLFLTPDLKDINIIRRRSIQTMGCHYTARKNEFSLVNSLYTALFFFIKTSKQLTDKIKYSAIINLILQNNLDVCLAGRLVLIL